MAGRRFKISHAQEAEIDPEQPIMACSSNASSATLSGHPILLVGISVIGTTAEQFTSEVFADVLKQENYVPQTPHTAFWPAKLM